MSLRILQPGTFSLLVDRGRPSTRSLGVPLGGAADRDAHAIGNALAGNCVGVTAVEITLSGPAILAERDVSACVFGAPFTCSVDKRAVPAGSLFCLRASQTLRIGGTDRGARAYLCVKGGKTSPVVLGSQSAFTPLAEGDVLICPSSQDLGRSLAVPDVESLLDEGTQANTLRVLDGPQLDWFPFADFFEQTYTASPSSNRMGVRLNGRPLARQPSELASEAVAPGSVQIANDGLPIVLGVDGQTIGGYPKIAQVIRADLSRIAQLRPGQAVRFERVNLDQAESIAAQRRRQMRRWIAALRLAAMK
jgi:5-oxoprolinase (ATP-hydrolysing) subunit C